MTDFRAFSAANAGALALAMALLTGGCGLRDNEGTPVGGCRGLAGSDEDCLVEFGDPTCDGQPCESLAIIFLGGAEVGDRTDLFEALALRGYAAVAIQPFETTNAHGDVPYLEEAERYDRAVREVTLGEWAESHWTGARLLFLGVSHGATAPAIAMARSDIDDAAAWRGAERTGACFLDGSYDQVATAELLEDGGLAGSSCTLPVPYTRWLGRYCGTRTADCDLNELASVDRDTIVDVSPEEFSIQDFRMVECGSGGDACADDIIPAEPIENLCSSIDSSPEKTCDFASRPAVAHTSCLAEEWDSCADWFESLP